MNKATMGVHNKTTAESTASAALSQQESSTKRTRSSSLGATVDSLAMRSVQSHGVSTALLIVVVGLAAAGLILALGIVDAAVSVEEEFARNVESLVGEIQRSWQAYEAATLWTHGACRRISRQEFQHHYEHLKATGLEFQAISCIPNVTHEERQTFEAASANYYAEHYPTVKYRGLTGEDAVGGQVIQRLPQSTYFPVHYIEPVLGNMQAIDFDLASNSDRAATIALAMMSGQPALTPRLHLAQETDPSAYSVILMHPGIRLESDTEPPRHLANMVIRLEDLLSRTAVHQKEARLVYVFDSTDDSFLGGVRVGHAMDAHLVLAETTLEHLRQTDYPYRREASIAVADREWTIVVVAAEPAYRPDLLLWVLSGVVISLASSCLAMYLYASQRRVANLEASKAKAEAEKAVAEAERAALVVESAERAAKAERAMNDYIAHEVRNPVAAAMSACSFVKSAVEKREPLSTEATREAVREDVLIIFNSLQFVNELLRNMLDMHRASSRQLQIDILPTDLLTDVLKPVESMLYRRGSKILVELVCAENLMVATDRMRLKQVVLNLARNSSKFLEKGFIRLRAEVVKGHVRIAVEDSGPGIPAERRDRLFTKFQESFDTLSQGTGIGLHLCKNLTELMGGNIWLDDTYHSGVDGCPGSRFVLDLNTPALRDDGPHCRDDLNDERCTSTTSSSTDDDESNAIVLPAIQRVLFVDDDMILRKLFARTIRKTVPGWTVKEAANGETALRLVETEDFDLIFTDQYMASVEVQLLGTETVQALRAKGVDCRIVGLSANDVEEQFRASGADAFMFKPFPCEPEALKQELYRILNL